MIYLQRIFYYDICIINVSQHGNIVIVITCMVGVIFKRAVIPPWGRCGAYRKYIWRWRRKCRFCYAVWFSHCCVIVLDNVLQFSFCSFKFSLDQFSSFFTSHWILLSNGNLLCGGNSYPINIEETIFVETLLPCL